MKKLPLLTVKDLGEFEDNLIKEYTHWFLFLNDNQRLIGRSYAWLKRPGSMQDMAFLDNQELLELRLIQQQWSISMRKLFSMVLPNYEWLGNEIQKHGGHGHLHMTPRYAEPVAFVGETFTDHFSLTTGGRPHREPPPGEPAFEKRLLPEATMKHLIEKIQAAL